MIHRGIPSRQKWKKKVKFLFPAICAFLLILLGVIPTDVITTINATNDEIRVESTRCSIGTLEIINAVISVNIKRE